VSQTDLEAESLQAINKPAPVEGALDNDLEVWFERVKQLSDERWIVSDFLLKMNGEVLIKDTQMSDSCGEIDTGVEHRGRSPF
jgi:hypothetical protein